MGAIADAAEDAKARVLAIGAQTGDAGVAAYQRAQQEIQASQQAAIARAHESARLIGAPSGINATLDETITRPSNRLIDSLKASEASFRAAGQGLTASSIGYLDKLKAREPQVEALLGGRGGRGGGGGGGGGRGGGGSDWGSLSDSETRVRLIGAAQQRKQGAVNQVLRAVQKKAGKRQQVSRQRGQTRQQIESTRAGRRALEAPKPVKFATRQQRQSQRRARGLRQDLDMTVGERQSMLEQYRRNAARKGYGFAGPGSLVRLDKRGRNSILSKPAPQIGGAGGDTITPDMLDSAFRGLGIKVSGLADRRRGERQRADRYGTAADLLRERVRLRDQAKSLDQSIEKQYGEAQELSRAPIGPIARDIGINEIGLDPLQVEGLITPKEDAAYSRAAAYMEGTTAPARYAMASALKVSPTKVGKLQRDALYRQARDQALGAIAEGTTWEDYKDGLVKIAAKARKPTIAKMIEYEFRDLFLSAAQKGNTTQALTASTSIG